MKKNKLANLRLGDPLCPCPLLNNQSGCNDANGWCYIFQQKWNYDCSAYSGIEWLGCEAGEGLKGIALTILQYGALPLAIYATAVAAGYIKSAES